MKNRRNVKGREDRRKHRALTYTYIYTEKGRSKTVP